jgi:hypothetical protein
MLIFAPGFKGYWADSNFVNFHKMKFANISEALDTTWQQNRAVYFPNYASANEVLKKNVLAPKMFASMDSGKQRDLREL